LKFTTEEQLRQRAKDLQQQSAESSAHAADSGSATNQPVSPALPSAAWQEFKSNVRPGLLEADFDDPTQMHDDETYEFLIITCSLHNRIFDLRTGDMITRSVVTKHQRKSAE